MVSPLLRYSPEGKYDVSLDRKTPVVGGKMVFPGGEVLLRNVYKMCTKCVQIVYGVCNSPGGERLPRVEYDSPSVGYDDLP